MWGVWAGGTHSLDQNTDTALRLARHFGTIAGYWMSLQKAYELRLAEQTVGKQISKTVKPRAA
jgi:plasmid maintenance system antidote protein VapI